MPFFRYLAVFSIFAILLTFMPIPSSACSCVEPGNAQEELDRADVVFSGKVIDSHDSNKKSYSIRSNDQVQYLFQVEEVWKGIDQSQVIVTSARDSASCGFEFSENVEYLVFATQGEVSIETGLCTLTGPLNLATDIIEELGHGENPSEKVAITLPEETVQEESKTFPRYLYIPIILSIIFIGFLILQKKKSRK